MRPCARQVPKIDARAILVPVPRSERVPPLILRLITRGLRLRSAALLSGGTSGWATKTRSSLMCFSTRRHNLAWTASESSRKGRQSASRRLSRASWALHWTPFPLPWYDQPDGSAGASRCLVSFARAASCPH